MTDRTAQAVDQSEDVSRSERWVHAPSDQSFEIDFGAMWGTLKRDAKIAARIAIAVAAAAVVLAFVLPVQYASSASFIPPTTGANSSAIALAGQLSALSGGSLLGGVKNSGDLYAGILRSRSIASELIARFDLLRVYGVKRESEAVKRLESNSTFDVGAKDSIVTITVRDKSPERARDLANGYLDALRETNGRLALTESSQRRLFFGQQLAKEKDDLEDAEVELKKTEEQSGLIAPTGQTAVEIETIAQTRAQIALRQVELASLRQSSTEQNPDVVRLRSEIADLEGQLSRLQTGNGKNEGGAIPTSKVPALELEYVRREREVKYHEALFEMLARQYEGARMDESREAPLLQVLDPASYPDARSSPPRLLIVAGGLIAGLLIGCGWVLGGDYARSLRPRAGAWETELSEMPSGTAGGRQRT